MSDNFEFLNNEPSQDEAEVQPQQQFIWESPFTPRYSPEEIAKQEEKKGIKKAANVVGISFCLVSAMPIILGIIIVILSGILEKNPLSDPAIEQIMQIAFSVLMFTVPFVACQKVVGVRISDLISFKRSEKGVGISLFFLGVAFCSFCNIGAAYLDGFFKAIGIDYSVGESTFPQGIFGFLLSVISTAVVPALAEEFALRGIVLGSLRKFGDGFALVFSAICFGVMHGNFEQIPFAFMMGLFLGFTVIKTDSLKVAIAVHFYNNFVSVIFSYLPDSISTEVVNIIYTVFLLCCFVIGILFLKNTDNDFFTVKNGNSLCSEKEKYSFAFATFGIIAFLIINFLEAFSFILINLVGG